MLRPLHVDCRRAYAAAQPRYRKPGWPVNRWRSLLPFNAILLGPVVVLHLTVAPLQPGRGVGLAAIFLVANGWLLVARAVSYGTFDRHLPRRADALRGNDARGPGRR